HRLGRDVTHRDVAAFSDQLARQLAPHACAAPGDDGDLSGEILHGEYCPLAFCLLGGSSWPGLTRPPTSFLPSDSKDVDARHKAGHDEFLKTYSAASTRWPETPNPS